LELEIMSNIRNNRKVTGRLDRLGAASNSQKISNYNEKNRDFTRIFCFNKLIL